VIFSLVPLSDPPANRRILSLRRAAPLGKRWISVLTRCQQYMDRTKIQCFDIRNH
jgi:hypothetical protein